MPGLGFGEVGVRLLDLAPEVAVVERGRFRLSPNPRLGYEPVPGVVYHGRELAYYDYRGAANSLGYRDIEHAPAKSPGTYRVVVIGDSVAAGLYITRLEHTFPRVLEHELRARGVPAEVINFGVSGYNTRQEVETLAVRGLRFAPDLVVLAYCLNDRERNDGDLLAKLTAEAEGAEVVDTQPPLITRSALCRLLWYRLLRGSGRSADAADVGEDTVEESLQRPAALSKQHGFEVLVAVFPDLTNLRDYAFADQHAFVRACAERDGLAVLDLLEPFRARGGRLGLDRYHPSQRGHRCAAEALAAEIAARRRAGRWS